MLPPTPTAAQGLPFLPQPVTTPLPTSAQEDAMRSVPPSQLDHTSIARLSRHLFTNSAEITSAPGDVITDHLSKKKRGKMPDPTNLTCSPLQRIHSTDSSLFAPPSIQSMPADPRFHPYPQTSPAKPPVNLDDKANITLAGSQFIAQMCLSDCWMSACEARRLIAHEALIYANAAALSARRPETVESARILKSVSRCAHVLLQI